MRLRYLELFNTGELFERAILLMELLKNCDICPNECYIDRTKTKTGKCFSDDSLVISSVSQHFGEEPPLVGFNGSGTIFLTSCNLKCLYCQNYDISHLRLGHKISIEDLAIEMLRLQNLGTHNINFVTPTHFVPQIVKALALAIPRGFNLPIVYNCGGYESLKTLKLLDGIIDIYMPDIKYSDNEIALKYSGIKNYWSIVRKAVKEMHKQVGDLKINKYGIAEKGLLIRHLILPNNIAGTEKVLKFIAEEISVESYVNIMDQYHPEYNAASFSEINRRISNNEFKDSIDLAKRFGLHRGFD
jgi:putative pyruvate formate lyase activating enzyme